MPEDNDILLESLRLNLEKVNKEIEKLKEKSDIIKLQIQKMAQGE